MAMSGDSDPEVVVYEIAPEQFSTGVLIDPTSNWFYSTDLAPRPYALQELRLGHLSGPVSTDVALFIRDDGMVERVQVTQNLPVEDQAKLLDAFGGLTFSPGKLGGVSVPSILLLHVEIGLR